VIDVRPPFLAIYVRAGRPGDRTLDEQVRLTSDYIAGQRVLGRWTDQTPLYYLDPTPPGREGPRDGMVRLFDDVWAGRIATVVSDQFARLGTTPKDAAATVSLLDGVHLVLLDEGIDTARPTGQVLVRFLRAAAVPDHPVVPAPERPGLRVGTYARASTRSEDSRAVIASQVRRAAEFVAERRWTEEWELISHEVYSDAGAGGRDHDRPGLCQLERDVQAGKLDVVVCGSLDRLSRDLSAFVSMMDDFADHRVRLIALRDGIDTGHEGGRLDALSGM
jgi:DNA invertase Pin-like site-specific DNA recombinase